MQKALARTALALVPRRRSRLSTTRSLGRAGLLSFSTTLPNPDSGESSPELGTQGDSLYDRCGGEAKLRPMCNDLYDLHASDPLTKDYCEDKSCRLWFGRLWFVTGKNSHITIDI